jgi:hypothetical protein
MCRGSPTHVVRVTYCSTHMWYVGGEGPNIYTKQPIMSLFVWVLGAEVRNRWDERYNIRFVT